MFLTTAILCHPHERRTISACVYQHSIFQSIALDLHINKHLLLYCFSLFFSLQAKCMCCDNRMEHRRPLSTNLFIFHSSFERRITFLFTPFIITLHSTQQSYDFDSVPQVMDQPSSSLLVFPIVVSSSYYSPCL